MMVRTKRIAPYLFAVLLASAVTFQLAEASRLGAVAGNFPWLSAHSLFLVYATAFVELSAAVMLVMGSMQRLGWIVTYLIFLSPILYLALMLIFKTGLPTLRGVPNFNLSWEHILWIDSFILTLATLGMRSFERNI